MFRVPQHGGRCAQGQIANHLVQVSFGKRATTALAIGMRASTEYLNPVGQSFESVRSGVGLCHAPHCAGQGPLGHGETLHQIKNKEGLGNRPVAGFEALQAPDVPGWAPQAVLNGFVPFLNGVQPIKPGAHPAQTGR